MRTSAPSSGRLKGCLLQELGTAEPQDIADIELSDLESYDGGDTDPLLCLASLAFMCSV